nr:MAG TPA: hypothetical protein [Caudoviricetes sp.]
MKGKFVSLRINCFFSGFLYSFPMQTRQQAPCISHIE